METFVWDENFITGLSMVDEQHHELVDLFNTLNRSLFSQDSNREQVLTDAYAQVIDYTRYHFRDEESLMQAEGLDQRHVDTHKALHEQFVQQVDALWAQREHLVDNPETIVGFLTAWLGLHILGIDQSTARQIGRIRAGATPEQAYGDEASAHDRSTQALLKMVAKLYHVLSVQNNALSAANAHLEERVTERTEQLARVNQELRAANIQLEAFSRTDGLLRIANRGYFDDRLANACASAHRRNNPMGLLMIDVDQFKRYNDHYGHQAGDACLQAVARAVESALLRETDLLARYGGEELAVILPDTDATGTRTVAERIVAAVAAMHLPHARSDAAPQVTVSVGGESRIPTGSQDAARLLSDADAALYHAKETGRNRWHMAKD